MTAKWPFDMSDMMKVFDPEKTTKLFDPDSIHMDHILAIPLHVNPAAESLGRNRLLIR